MATNNDMQFTPAHNIIQTGQPKSGVVTHQPPAYGQINTQSMQNPHQNPTVSGYIYQNGQMIPVPYIINGMNHPYALVRNPAKGRDYCNIVWSSCNILCCFFLFGIVALVLSILTLRMRRDGNNQGAQCTMIWAIVVNAFATIIGIIAFVILYLHYAKTL